jgi:hypothetical protein
MADRPPLAAPTTERLLYLYAILPRESAASQLLAEGKIAGIAEAPLFAIETGSLVAVVNEVPSESFAEEPLNELLQDLERLAPIAVRHEEAIAALVASATALIPMTFGTIYRTEAGITRLLHDREAEFLGLLDRLEGKQEWGIRLHQVRETAFREASATEAVLTLDAELASASPGRAYLLGKRREALLHKQAEQAALQAIADIAEVLRSASAAYREFPVVIQQQDPEPLVFRAAFLVPTSDGARFQYEAETLDTAYRDRGYRVSVAGPWAAYSFVTDRVD